MSEWATFGTRLLEGILSRSEKRFAKTRRHSSPYLSSTVCCPPVGRRYEKSGSVREDTAATHVASYCHSDTRVRVRKCTLDSNSVRKSVCHLRQNRRRCQYGLLSTTRLLENMLSRSEKRSATVRNHASPSSSSPVCYRPEGRRYRR